MPTELWSTHLALEGLLYPTVEENVLSEHTPYPLISKWELKRTAEALGVVVEYCSTSTWWGWRQEDPNSKLT